MDWVRNHRTLLLIEGILFILMGGVAIILPVVSTLSLEMFIGFLLIFSGAVQLFRAFKLHRAPPFVISLLMGLIGVVCGILMLLYPVAGVMSLTILLTIFFLLDGIMKIVLGFQSRPTHYWGWLVFNGLLSLIIAYIIWHSWPSSAFWVLGLLFGINMIFFGVSLISLSAGVARTPPPSNP